MNRSVPPGVDFLEYACGSYLKNLTIPPDRGSYGVRDTLFDLSQKRTLGILKASASMKDAAPGSEDQKIGDFFSSFLDEATIEAKGLEPLKPYLNGIAAISNRSQLAKYFGLAGRIGVKVPLAFSVGAGRRDVYSLSLRQGGLGLPDRNHYLDLKQPKFARIRAQYTAHIASMLRLAGFGNSEARSKDIFNLEVKLAEAQWSNAETHRTESHTQVKLEDLITSFPGFDWTELIAAVGVQKQKNLNVTTPSAIATTAQLLAKEPLETWKDYLTFRVLKAAAPSLPNAFVKENFDFDGAVLSGLLEIPPRKERAVAWTSRALRDAIGKRYVASYFPPQAKQQADLMVQNIIAAMDQRLARLTWMDPPTKIRARSKLASIASKIGYPSKWRDYSGLEIRRGDALGNSFRAAEFDFQRRLEDLGKLVDPADWNVAPMEVNAFASSSINGNEIVFPAAVFQPPYFDPNADLAVNYGGIGAVIGHEICHHFDDKGRRIDEAGFSLNWWTLEDAKRYKVLSEKVVKQYSTYEPIPGVHVNGERTLGENIADLAGLNIAYEAYRMALHGKPAEVIEGFTGDQRFFLAFAQSWCSKYREKRVLQQLATGIHPPAHLRVNVVRNLDAWYAAFGVTPEQAMYLAPEERIRFW